MNARLPSLAAAAALVVLSLAGCKPDVDPEQPLRYSCSFDGGPGEASPCAEGFVCGFDNLCHPETGDPTAGCRTDEHCQGTFRCGTDRLCFDPSVAPTEARACVPDESDPDAGASQCPDGYRCGLDRFCHDGDGGAYLCKGDEWCEAGWRCGSGGRCLDPSAEALVASSLTLAAALPNAAFLVDGLPELASLEPRTGNDNGGQFSGDRTWSYAVGSRAEVTIVAGGNGPFSEIFRGSVTLPSPPSDVATFDGSKQLLVRFAGGGASLFDVAPVAGRDGGLTFTEVTPPPQLPSGPLRYLDVGGNGRLSLVVLDPNGADGGEVVLLGRDGGAFSERRFPLQVAAFLNTGGGPPVIYDAGVVGLSDAIEVPTGQGECLLVASAQGFLIGRRDRVLPFNGPQSECYGTSRRGGPPDPGSCLEPFPLPGAHPTFCPPANASRNPLVGRVLRLRSLPFEDGSGTRYGLAALVEKPDGGLRIEAWNLNDVGANEDAICRGGCPDPQQESIGHDRLFEELDPCSRHPGSRLKDFALLPPDQGQNSRNLRIEARCFVPDGGVDAINVWVPGEDGADPSRVTAEGTSSALFTTATAQTVEQERVGLVSRTNLYEGLTNGTAASSFIDAPPDALVRVGQGSQNILIGFSPRALVVATPGVGFVSSTEDVDKQANLPVAAVQGVLPGWAVMGGRQVIDGNQVSFQGAVFPVYVNLEGTSTQFDPPYLGHAARRPDGGVTLFVSAGQNLYAGDISTVAALPTPPETPASLLVRNVPFAGGNITSLVGLPPSLLPRGAIASAYVLATSGLAQVTATSETRYRASELELPDGEAIEVWLDGERARVGMLDGRVFSLPSRLQIGERLPLVGEDRVHDFGQACGQSYAVTDKALYRLSQGPGPIGQWVPEPAAADFIASLPEGSFAGGRMIVAPPEIYLFAGSGRSALLTVSGCPNP